MANVQFELLLTCFFLAANYYKRSKGFLDKKRLAAILVASIVSIVFLLLFCVHCIWRRKRKGM
jgi:FlaA1/EpsC-like NDP-sugar epimerase